MAVSQTKEYEVYQWLRAKILHTEFPPSHRLREQELCDHLKVTRTPLRLALGRLEHERLIVAESYRGCHVREVHPDEVAPLFDLREVLEGLAAHNIALQHNEETLEVIVALAQGCDHAEQNEEWTRYFALDRQLHREIVQRSGNEKLVEVMEICDFQLRTFSLHDRYLSRVIEQLHSMSRELPYNHRDLVNALASGNPNVAEAEMRTHIRRSKKIVLRACDQTL